MESRNVKIVDEHGIDRDAHVICGLKIMNLDYVLYSIERDGENDNLFISKIVNNFDGTSNMVNIEDEAEKGKLNGFVKELVTYAINNEADKLNGNVKLSDGTDAVITSLRFNKEQNINVSKTYVTTVKKNVTRVSENFYTLPEVSTPTQEENFFDTVKNDIFEPVATENVVTTPEVATMPSLDTQVEVTQEAVPAPEIQAVPSPAPVVPEPAPTASVETTPESEVVPLPAAPVPAAPEPPVETTPAVDPILPATEPAQTNLVFDASKETNLNEALGEVGTGNTVPVDSVESLREFGQGNETPVATESAATIQEPVVPEVKNGGFANKKFFMVIAILFFVGACVFLGYEAFKYFQLTK